MSDLLRYTIFGLAFAGVYFIAASGLVVTYTTSGIFNFAHGAVAMIAAFSYWELREQHHWPAPLAFVGVVFVLAPIMGVVIERLIMRNLGSAATITTIVVTIGLLVTLLGIGSVVWAPSKFAVTPLASEVLRAGCCHRRGCADPVALPVRARLSVVVAAGLWVLLTRTRLGIAMRAVVDDREPGPPQRREPRRRVGRGLGRRLDARRAGRSTAGADPRARRGPPHPVGDQRVRGRGRRQAAQPSLHRARAP